MGQRTPTEVLALWTDLRDNYSAIQSTSGISLEGLLLYALLGTSAGSGGTATLPSGAATDARLVDILNQLKVDRSLAASQYTDATGAVYFKVLTYDSTNGYQASNILNGSPYTPTAPEQEVNKSDYDTTETVWEITTAGTGYAVGDNVSQYTFLKQGPPASVAATLWFNQTTGFALSSAPLSGHRRRLGAVAATEATLSTRLSEGAPITGETIPSGSGALGWLSSLRQRLDSLLARFPLTIGTKASAESLSVVLASDQATVPTTVTDGTNTAAVKAASAAAAATDPALVVSLSPNGNAVNTELPTAAALADAYANPTTPTVGSANLGFNGTTWERLRSGISSVFTTVTGVLNSIPMGQFLTTPPTLSNGNFAPLQVDANGRLLSNSDLIRIAGTVVDVNSGSASAGTQRVVQAQLTTTFAGAVPQTASDYALSATARIRKLKFLNENAAVMYVGIYSSAAALAAASVPLNGLVWRVPANSDVTFGVGDFGETGTFYGATTRIGISSTRNTYTALTAPQLAASAVHIETV
jgi:hypothetical protein